MLLRVICLSVLNAKKDAPKCAYSTNYSKQNRYKSIAEVQYGLDDRIKIG
jgi:hypothetical protein